MPSFDIHISLPMQSNSISEVAKATAPFIAELEALKQKLPEAAVYKDAMTGVRLGAQGTRKSLAQRIQEAVEADRMNRDDPANQPPTGDPTNQPSNGERRVSRGVHAG